MTHEDHHKKAHHHSPAKKPLHHDWRLWTAVVIMLVAITVYILSGDEMFGFRPKPAQPPAPPAAK